MVNFLKWLIPSALLIVLYFSLQKNEEVKVEQRIRDANTAVHAQKFDNDFADAFNNTPAPGKGAQIQKQRAEELADLEHKAAQARAKRDELDEMFSDSAKKMYEAINGKGEGAKDLTSMKDKDLADYSFKGAEAK